MMTRRQALKTTALATAAVASMRGAFGQGQPKVFAAPAGQPLITTASNLFTLPPLPYAYDALEPHLDARTMEIHHDKHHAAYVTNLNKAVADYPDLGKKTIEDLVKGLNSVPEPIRMAVRNQGGGHYNHSLFWQLMKKDGGGEPRNELAKAIEANFGSFSNFKIKFTEAAMKVFGSGWAWLEIGSDGKWNLNITQNQDSPIMDFWGTARREAMNYAPASLQTPTNSLWMTPHGANPILGLDVWEHAYYLKYQNKRADYIAAWWNVVNWDFVAERYAKVKG